MLKTRFIIAATSTAFSRSLQNLCHKTEIKENITVVTRGQNYSKNYKLVLWRSLCCRQQEINHEVTANPNTSIGPEGTFQWDFCLRRDLSPKIVTGTILSLCKSDSSYAPSFQYVTVNFRVKLCQPLKLWLFPILLRKLTAKLFILQNSPLSSLLKSTQFCHYNIDAKKRHIRDAVCSEKHLFLPSSYK